MSRPWMPFYVGDYLRDTAHLTTLQHGAYIKLLMHYWNKGPIADDDKELATITGLSVHGWKRIRPKIERFFQVGAIKNTSSEALAEQLPSNCWMNKRLDAELEKADLISLKRKMAGQRGGLKSNGHQNMQRYLNGAIGKQTGNQSQRKKDIATPPIVSREAGQPTKEIPVSPFLTATMKEKGWMG